MSDDVWGVGPDFSTRECQSGESASVALGIPVIGARNAEVLAVEGGDAERQRIGRECLTPMSRANDRVQRLPHVTRFDHFERIPERRVRHAAPDAEQTPNGAAEP